MMGHATTWQQLADMFKAAVRGGHKYVRREPKPGGGYRYYYSEARTAAKVEAGHRIRIGEHTHDVESANAQGIVTLKHTGTGKRETLHAADLHKRLHESYRDRYARGAERVAKAMLREVKGLDVDKLKAEPMKAWQELGERFKAAGVPREQALALFRTLGQAKGWGTQAKAVMVAMASDKQLGRYVTGSRTQIMRGASNLARADQKRLKLGEDFRLSPVEPKHVVMAVKSRLPAAGGAAGEKAEELRRNATDALGRLDAMLTAIEAVGPGAPDALRHYAETALKSDALAELSVAADAYPGLADAPEVKRLRELEGRHHALTAGHGKAKSDGGRGVPGADTTVYVADVTGAPTPQRAKYRLVEVGDIKASHDPTKGFAPNKAYPKGLQERAYHRDRAEQQKVQRNAQQMRPDLVTNTNPDAANGPPIITKDGVVLGGNSRTMSLGLVHDKGGKKQQEYLDHLKQNAATFGLTPAEVDSMKAPVLVREVDAPKEDLGVLVRRYNEVFTQAMDPRTDQVARARLVTDGMLQTLATGMVGAGGEPKHKTLNAYLDSSDGGAFIGAMERAGIVDERNRSQYMRQGQKGTRPQLNEDGKRLVQRLLVGRLVPDPDTLGDVTSQQMRAISQSMPHIIRAKGAGHDVTPALREALQAHRYMRLSKMKSPAQFDQSPELGEVDRAAGSGMPSRPKLSPQARHVLEVMHSKPGHIAHSGWWREFAEHAEKNPAGQGGMFGPSKTTADLLGEVRSGKHKEAQVVPITRAKREEQAAQAEEETAAAAAQAQASRAQSMMFASLTFIGLADMVKAAMQLELFKKPTARPMGAGWQPIPAGKHGGYRKREGGRWVHWYPQGGGPGDKRPATRTEGPTPKTAPAEDMKALRTRGKALIDTLPVKQESEGGVEAATEGHRSEARNSRGRSRLKRKLAAMLGREPIRDVDRDEIVAIRRLVGVATPELEGRSPEPEPTPAAKTEKPRGRRETKPAERQAEVFDEAARKLGPEGLGTQRAGRRTYAVGPAYANREALKARGFKWDAKEKVWWSGSHNKAVSSIAGINTKGLEAKQRRREAASKRQEKRRTAKPTDNQIDYASRLLARTSASDWHDTDFGQSGGPKPGRSDLRGWSRGDVSALIDDLRGMYRSLSFTDMVKAVVQRDMFGGPAVAVASGARAKQGRQLGLFGDAPKKDDDEKKKRKKGALFYGPKGGAYIDPAHTISAKHDNPHGGKLRSGTVIRGPRGHLHEVKHVGAHHKTGRVHVQVDTPKGPQVFAANRVKVHKTNGAGQAGLFASLSSGNLRPLSFGALGEIAKALISGGPVRGVRL